MTQFFITVLRREKRHESGYRILRSSMPVVALLLTLASCNANAAEHLFNIEQVERAEVPFRDKPGHSVMFLARFRWIGSTHKWVATLSAVDCSPSAAYRAGLIGAEDTSLAPHLASYADKHYEWTMAGPKPIDKLFWAICKSQ
jgi:hypothetical protein